MAEKYSNTGMKWLSIVLLILSIVYIIVPFDYDETIIGRADDFFLFMSAFCFMYAQFLRNRISPYVLLKMLSAVFCFLGAVSLILLAFCSK